MYLKTLTIRGFKSFASKTTFEFEPGITSVIGPNGSGKSNVVDALAWVMGEQGVKNLRGGKMEDVIFAGTTGRAPLGRAQVELTIDNSDGTLPIEYSEVTISRTLFRSGGSEYQINGVSARLLDIQELLSDSGLGREMHVIVGQGQLDRILQATPEERRGFIEEAAGILKHRRRKERSERKLESMRANLDRIRDLADEVKRQLGPLSKQAETAQQAQNIQHDVRDASARLLADDIWSQTKKLNEVKAGDGTLQQQLEQLQNKLVAAEDQTKLETIEFEQTSQAASSAREHRYQLTSLAERFRSLQALANERLKTASRPAVASSGLSPEEAQRQLADHQEALQELIEKVQELQASLEQASQAKERAEREARVAAETYTQIIRAEADQQKSVAKAESAVQSATARHQALVSRLELLEEENTHSSHSAEQAQLGIATLENEAQQLQEQLSLVRSDLETAQEKFETASKDRTRIDGEVRQLHNETSATHARIEVLKHSLQPETGSGLAILHELDPIDLSEIMNIQPGWEKAISALFAGSTDRLWVDSTQKMAEIVQKLRANEVSDVRIFYPGHSQDSVKQNSAEGRLYADDLVSPKADDESTVAIFQQLQRQLSRFLIVETLEEAFAILALPGETHSHSQLKIATKQGDVVTSQWVEIRGQGGDTSLERRAAYDKALHEYEDLIETYDLVRQQQSDTHEYYETCQRELQQHQQAAQKLQTTLSSVREKISVQTRNLEQQKATELRAMSHKEQLANDATAMAIQVQKAQEHFDAVQEAAVMVESSDQGAHQAAQAQQKANEHATAARTHETEVRLTLRTSENAQQQAEQRVEQSQRRLSSATIAQQEYQRALVRQRHTVKRLTALTETLEMVIQRVKISVDRAQQDFELLEEQRTEIQGRLEHVQQAAVSTRKELNQLQQRLNQHQLVRQEHEINLAQLHEKALSELGYSHQYLMEHFGPDVPVDLGDDQQTVFDRSQQQQRLRKAKRNLTALGKINPLALEEYTAVQQRYDYLTQQLSDLENSRKDLLKIIADVNATVLEIFGAAYADTAAEFEHVFATLFPGGEGHLSLTEPDNLLTTGIEVTARPAGKRVKQLSLLSGGERSLAAIALLVSIFKARPSPFYVMDEVEAALDDTNLTRLLTIFKELQTDSQLIIITHQKRTMEISDALYGVSMRGDGISQVISQKLTSN